MRLWFLMVMTLLMAVTAVQAQDERLTNPGLEEGTFGPYTTRRGGEFPIYLPTSWNVWLASPTGEFFNRGDRTTINPHPGPGPAPREGARALNVDCGYVTCTVAVYQQISVQSGQNVQASAWAQVKACNIAPNANTCGSAVESGAQTRIGIDPNGGTDPNDSDVVWSGWAQPHDVWEQMSVSATTTGTTVTLFLYSRQGSTADLNRTYWDQASLTGGGSGGSAEGAGPAPTPIPTAPPSVPFVVPQGERVDGSIVHVVAAGDTIDSIAVAYGLTRQQIMELNNLRSLTFIQIGQEIIIRPPLATEGETLTDEIDEDGEPVAATPQPLEVAELAAETETEEPTEEAPAAEAEEPADMEPTEEVPAEPTRTPAPAPVVSVADGNVVPASDPSRLGASVCVALFNDGNRNRIQDVGEELLSGGTINLTAAAEILQTRETDGTAEPFCFENVEPGSYTLVASAPAGYGLTSPDQLRLQALAGVKLDVSFGAAEGVEAVQPPPADAGGLVSETAAEETDTRSITDSLLQNSGLIVFGLAAVVLVGGLGLSLLLRRR